MKKKKVGMIRVLTTDDDSLLKSHENILKERFTGLEIETKCIKDQPKGVYDDYTLRIAVPKIVELAHEFEDRGFDIVNISCAGDPGLEECRKELRIPVIGAGSSCASLALSFGSKIGVMGITEKAPEAVYKILKGHLVCDIRPEGVNTVLDLYTDKGIQKVIAAANQFKEKGCDVIALACTGMSTIKVYKKISVETNIITIDPVIASGIVISYL
ncbi:MAG: aspartate/glutamate racemase family protein [Firmicutes bacterium]|nr:aspartate/glutamate racemase family protein [Bacillota bacterium]